MGASEWGKPPKALRAKGVEKEEEDRRYLFAYMCTVARAGGAICRCLLNFTSHTLLCFIHLYCP
jgi:energy-converting hydrogenase Eha subunit H